MNIENYEMRKLYAILARLSPWPWPAPNLAPGNKCRFQSPCHHSHIRLLTPLAPDTEGHLQVLSQRETLRNVSVLRTLQRAGL